MSEITSYSFRIYVTGETTRSWQAVANLHRLCEAQLAGHYEMEVVDVAERPELAEQERIIATPTVVRQAPPPRRRVIGDLSDLRLTAVSLGLPEAEGSTWSARA
jgi:circadian clock protein KaiB